MADLLLNEPTLKDLEEAYTEYIYILKNGVITGPNGLAATLGISAPTAFSKVAKLKLRQKYSLKIVENKNIYD